MSKHTPLREALDALENAMIMARLPTDDRDADILNAAADVVAAHRRARAARAALAAATGDERRKG